MSTGQPLERRHRLLLVVVLMLSTVTSDAAQWRAFPRVGIEETWSDNIQLAPSGREEHDFVTQITPGVGLTGRGGRLTLDFDYQATLTHYARGSDDGQVDHRLQSTANAELVDQYLFVDVQGVIGQRNTLSSGLQTTDLVNVSDNRSRFATLRVSPYLRYRLGRHAAGQARYSLERVVNEDSVNSTLQRLSADVSSGSEFTRLPWSVGATVRREDNSTGTTSEFRDVTGSVRYVFNRRYSIRASVGYEKNDFRTLRDDTDGPTWRISGIWTPTNRTSLEAGYGGEFFGNSFSLNLSHRMRKAVFTATYAEDATTTAAQQADRLLFPLQDAFGEDIENPGAVQVRIPTNTATVTDQVFISRDFNFGLSVRGRRTSGSIQMFHTRRDFEFRLQNDERVFGILGTASRILSRRTSVSASGSWQRSDFGRGDEDTLWTFNLGATRSVMRDVTASVSYEYSRNDSSASGTDYTENRVSARVDMTF